jgi:hypothetical protein
MSDKQVAVITAVGSGMGAGLRSSSFLTTIGTGDWKFTFSMSSGRRAS